MKVFVCAVTLETLLSHAMRLYSVRSGGVLLAIRRAFSKTLVIKVLETILNVKANRNLHSLGQSNLIKCIQMSSS